MSDNEVTELQEIEVLHVHHAVDHVLRLFAEWVVRVILPQVGFQRSSNWVRFELMNQLFDYFFTCMVFLLNCRVWWSLNPRIDFTETGLPVLAGMDVGCSLFNACSVRSSFVPRRFQYNSLPWTKRFIDFVVKFFFWTQCRHLLNTHCWWSVVKMIALDLVW